MRKLLLLSLFIIPVLFSGRSYAQINVFHIDKDVQPTSRDGVFYALPRTVVRIDVTIDKVENYKGPYSEFALKYLGLKNIIEANSVEYKVTGIQVTTSAQPDPDQYYFVEVGKKLSKNEKAGLLSLNESGLLLGTMPSKWDTLPLAGKAVFQTPVTEISEKDIFPEIFKYSADISFFEKIDTIIRKVNIDTMTLERQYYKRTVIEKSPEQKAKEAADFIQKIKDSRFNLISGMQEVNYNKETLEYLDAQLKTMEKEYMKLFTGISIHKASTFTYLYTPNPNQVNTEVPIFKFSKSKGFRELDDPSGKVVTIKVQRSGTTGMVSDYLNKVNSRKSTHGFYYRIPELARVTVRVDSDIQDETQCLVNQLGIVSFLPPDKWKVKFYDETGGIRNIIIE
ncbi:MAG: DUF4831 family protein [Bacteroidota bacterium]|nr:DUF4831 family protein [Bacteroidota bacterium]